MRENESANRLTEPHIEYQTEGKEKEIAEYRKMNKQTD